MNGLFYRTLDWRFHASEQMVSESKEKPMGNAFTRLYSEYSSGSPSGWGFIQSFAAMSSHLIIDGTGIGKFWPDYVRQGDPNSDDPPPDWLRLIMDQCMHLICLYSINRWL